MKTMTKIIENTLKNIVLKLFYFKFKNYLFFIKSWEHCSSTNYPTVQWLCNNVILLLNLLDFSWIRSIRGRREESILGTWREMEDIHLGYSSSINIILQMQGCIFSQEPPLFVLIRSAHLLFKKGHARFTMVPLKPFIWSMLDLHW